MRHIVFVGLCSLLLVACGWPSRSSSALRAAGAGAPVPGSPESPVDGMSAEIPADVKTAMEKLQSPNRNEQADAIMKLRYMKDRAEPALPLLIRMLGSDAKFPVMKLLSSSLAPKTQSCSPEPTFGGEAAETLACLGKTSEELLGLLKDRRWQVRANAARAVGGIKDARAINLLTSLVSDRDEHPVVRGNAALALALMEAVSAVDPLIPLLKDKDPRVRAAAASALGRLHDSRAVPPLIVALGDANARVRQAVVGGLGSLGGPLVFDPLVRSLADPDGPVREVAAAALGRMQDARAVEPLLAALSDPYANVRINAAGALGVLHDLRALEPLIHLLRDDNEAVRGAAAEALGQLNDPRAVRPLSDMAHREESEIPLARALRALAALGHTGSKEAYDRYLAHPPDWKPWWTQNKDRLLDHK
jgi:HEAT repeat protein